MRLELRFPADSGQALAFAPPLLERRLYLRHAKADDDFLRYSEEFEDAERLLATAARMGLDGIVSKLAD